MTPKLHFLTYTLDLLLCKDLSTKMLRKENLRSGKNNLKTCISIAVNTEYALKRIAWNASIDTLFLSSSPE